MVSAPVAVLGYSGLKTQRRDRGRGGHRRGGLHLLHSLTEGGRGQTDNSSKLKTESSRPRIEGRRSLRKEAPDPEQQQKSSSRRREEDQGRVERRRRGEKEQGMEERTGEEDHRTEKSSPIKAKTRLGSKASEKPASRVSDMTDAKPANRMSEARVRLTRIKVHHVTEARVRLTRVRVTDHVTEVKGRKVRLSGTYSQSDPRDTNVSMTTKHNSWLASGPGGSHLKNWGKFRIPKRSERPEEPSNPNPPQHRPLNPNPPQRRPPNPNPPQRRPLHSEPSYPRRRLRTESDGYSSNSETPPSGLDMKACLKRCHAHQLRGGSYGSDIIHQGVLAS